MRYQHGGYGQPHRVAVEVDHAEAALGVGVPQEAGPGQVRAAVLGERRHHQVPQRRLPGRVGPDPGDQGGRHRQRAHQPGVGLRQALPFVALQPLRELLEPHHLGVRAQLARHLLQRPPRGVTAHHPRAVQRHGIAARRLDPAHSPVPSSTFACEVDHSRRGHRQSRAGSGSGSGSDTRGRSGHPGQTRVIMEVWTRTPVRTAARTETSGPSPVGARPRPPPVRPRSRPPPRRPPPLRPPPSPAAHPPWSPSATGAATRAPHACSPTWPPRSVSCAPGPRWRSGTSS